MAWVTTVEWQIAAVVRLSPENGAAALTQMPSTVAIGKIAHTVKRPDIIAIKTVRNAKVSAIFSCVREKSRLSFNGNGSCQYPGSKITALDASDTGYGGDSGAALGFLMSVVANALLYALLGVLVSFIYRRFFQRSGSSDLSGYRRSSSQYPHRRFRRFSASAAGSRSPRRAGPVTVSRDVKYILSFESSAWEWPPTPRGRGGPKEGRDGPPGSRSQFGLTQ